MAISEFHGMAVIYFIDFGSFQRRNRLCGICNKSRTIPKRFLPRDGRFRLIEAPHVGVMHAVITGYKAARHELIANMDSDDATDPSEFERLAPYLKDAGLVTGSRVLRGDLPPVEKSLMRQILSKGFSTLFAALLRLWIDSATQVRSGILKRQPVRGAALATMLALARGKEEKPL